MFQLCRHIKTNGKRCQSPALAESAYCYFHVRTHAMASPNFIKFDDLKLPLLEDSASIQAAIFKITSAFLSARLDARQTGLLLYAVQIASQNIDRDSDRENTDIVRSMTVTDDCDEMAPKKEVCEPSDCPGCNKRDTCDECDHNEEDVRPMKVEKRRLSSSSTVLEEEQPIARAVGAVLVSPALQRGVEETSNISGVP